MTTLRRQFWSWKMLVFGLPEYREIDWMAEFPIAPSEEPADYVKRVLGNSVTADPCYFRTLIERERDHNEIEDAGYRRIPPDPYYPKSLPSKVVEEEITIWENLKLEDLI